MKFLTSLIFTIVSFMVIQSTLGSQEKSVAQLLGSRVSASDLQAVNFEHDSQLIRRILDDDTLTKENGDSNSSSVTPVPDSKNETNPSSTPSTSNDSLPATSDTPDNQSSATNNSTTPVANSSTDVTPLPPPVVPFNAVAAGYNVTSHVNGKLHQEYNMSFSTKQAIHLTGLDEGKLITYVVECDKDPEYALIKDAASTEEPNWKEAEDDFAPIINETNSNSSYYLLLKPEDKNETTKACIRTSFIPASSTLPTDVFSLPTSETNITYDWNAINQHITLTWPSLDIKNDTYLNMFKDGPGILQINYTLIAIKEKGDDDNLERIAFCGNGSRDTSEIFQQTVIMNKANMNKTVSFSFIPADVEYYVTILVSVSNISAANHSKKEWEIYYVYPKQSYEVPEEVLSDMTRNAPQKSSKGWGWGVWLIFLVCIAAIGYGAYKYKEKRDNDNALIVQQPLRNNEDTSTYYELTNRNNNQ